MCLDGFHSILLHCTLCVQCKDGYVYYIVKSKGRLSFDIYQLGGTIGIAMNFPECLPSFITLDNTTEQPITGTPVFP